MEDSQVVMAMFRTVCNSIFGITTACTTGTNKITHTVCWKGVIIIGKIPLVGASPDYLAVYNSTEPTKAKASLGNFTVVQTKAAAKSGLGPGRIFWKTVGFTSTGVNPLDLRPDFIKVGPDTICTEAYYIGDDWAAFAAVSAKAQAISKYSFANISHVLPKKISAVGFQVSDFGFLLPDTRNLKPEH